MLPGRTKTYQDDDDITNLTLDNFEEVVPEKILERGRDYWERGTIVDCSSPDGKRWKALVEGTETYSVSISLSSNSIVDTSCDCPYDGEICKHVVALIFYVIFLHSEEPVEEKPKHTHIKEETKIKKKKKKKNDLSKILSSTSEEELREFVREHAEHNPAFATLIRARLRPNVDGPDAKENYVAVIRSALGESRFLYRSEAGKAFGPVFELLATATKCVTRQHYTDALAIAQAVIEEIPALTSSVYGSHDQITDCIDTSFSVLHIISSAAAPELRDAVFRYCATQACDLKYEREDVDIHFFNLMIEMVQDGERKRLFLEMLDILLTKRDNNYDKSSSLRREERYLKVKIRLFEKFHDEDEIDSLINRNLHHDTYLQMAIDRAIERKDFAHAHTLADEGIQRASTKYPYEREPAARKWKEYLLRLAETEHNTEQQKILAEELLLASYDINFYRRLRRAYSPDEWKSVSEQLQLQLRKSRTYPAFCLLCTIAAEEKEWEQLLALVTLQPHLKFLREFQKPLLEHYPEEFFTLYEKNVYERANLATRKFYRDAIHLLTEMKNLGAGDRIGRIVKSLRERHNDRPSLLEELTKAKL